MNTFKNIKFLTGITILALAFFLNACEKEQVQLDQTAQVEQQLEPAIISTVEGQVADRDCSPCAGSLYIFTSVPSVQTPISYRIQTKACPSSSWTTSLTSTGVANGGIMPFSVGHELYYRIIVTNNSATARTFSSRIINPPGLGSITALLGTIPPGVSVAAEYDGKGNCGCQYVYDCSFDYN